MLAGIDDKKKLLEFFGAKQHKNLVLRVVDVLDLCNSAQEFLRKVVCGFWGVAPARTLPLGTLKQVFLHFYPAGYIVLPFKAILLHLSLEEIQTLQGVVYGYRDIRRSKGFPSRVDKCSCEGRKGCEKCCGVGEIVTFLEMSEEERGLAKREFVR
jgi:hypothetical protein